ncbi:peptidylprolyl isomerase [Roseibium sp. Sym1]|uniref:peptidylprolyl isomerase n=1 Tax=Roseibium sp. Sym1 TaxID=3016006 RepID=UPI0022B55C63|nr:peptidylprolyl isomerase [Roseibium sp. Sym1]
MILQKLLKSPLVHFFAIGGLVFAGYALTAEEPVLPPADTITLSAGEAGRIADRFAATWNRPPTPDELAGLMRSWALEEAFVREALELGLDRGDPVIRQRLKLKMEFLAESGAGTLVPGDEELEAFLAENPDRFKQPARLAFDQILLPEEMDDDRIADLFAALKEGADPAGFGNASLLPPSVPVTQAQVIDRTFGNGFHAALADLPLNTWQGPVESGYGRHLVRVTERRPAVLPPLTEIREDVQSEWRARKARQMREAFSDAMLERYTVTLPAANEVLATQ